MNECYNKLFLSIKSRCYNECGGILFILEILIIVFTRESLFIVFTKERLFMLFKFTCTVYKVK